MKSLLPLFAVFVLPLSADNLATETSAIEVQKIEESSVTSNLINNVEETLNSTWDVVQADDVASECSHTKEESALAALEDVKEKYLDLAFSENPFEELCALIEEVKDLYGESSEVGSTAANFIKFAQNMEADVTDAIVEVGVSFLDSSEDGSWIESFVKKYNVSKIDDETYSFDGEEVSLNQLAAMFFLVQSKVG